MGRYFDYNATAPVYPEARAAIDALLAEPPGNPSSIHAAGRRGRALLDEARRAVARLLGADPRGVIFTSGATESNNLVLRGVSARRPDLTIVTTRIDHASVLATVDALERAGREVVRLDVDAEGRFDLEALAQLTAERPCLFSSSWANGECGTITDVSALTERVAEGTIVHMDGAQAAGRFPIFCGQGVHFLSISAHKFGGPPGVGALAMATDEPPEPLATGGPQERGMRAGTENLTGVVAMAAAADYALEHMDDEWQRLEALRERLWQMIAQRPGGLLRVSPADGLRNTLTVGIEGVRGDVVVASLDLEGFAVSTGSACAAGAAEPSHVVQALGVEARYRDGVLRISMGRDTRERDVDELAETLATVVTRARSAQA